jgi:hypothetical protein
MGHSLRLKSTGVNANMGFPQREGLMAGADCFSLCQQHSAQIFGAWRDMVRTGLDLFGDERNDIYAKNISIS